MTTENGMVPGWQMRQYIKRFIHRRNYLLEKVKTDRHHGIPLKAHEVADLQALDWAIPILEQEHLMQVELRKKIRRP